MFRTYLFVVSVLLFPGCSSSTAFLFPLEGPLSEESPVPSIQAAVNGTQGNTGDIELTMPNGENCSGEWSYDEGDDATLESGGLLETYGSVYGTSTSVDTGQDRYPGQAFLDCDQGRTIEVEFVTGGGTGSEIGFARDDQGNIYRVLF